MYVTTRSVMRSKRMDVMTLRKQLREADQEMKRFSKSNRRSVSYKRKRQTSSSDSDISKTKSATAAESGATSDQSTFILTPSPSSDVFPQSQYSLFSPPATPSASLSDPQPSQLTVYCLKTKFQLMPPNHLRF